MGGCDGDGGVWVVGVLGNGAEDGGGGAEAGGEVLGVGNGASEEGYVGC